MILLENFFNEGTIFFQVCGYIASIGLILGYVPQALLTIRTRNTDGISLPGFIAMAVGCFAFILQGLMLGIVEKDGSFPGPGFFIFFTNLITFTCSVIIFIIKMRNDSKKRKAKKEQAKK
ncbi:MAG: PQ-loop repeat-containing protein [Muribaculaceae bacterium]|nr:PQ-loop repeat-containing protein [Muribaculaceae bacterium]